MNIIVILIPLAFGLAVFFLWCFIKANQSGQFDDLDTPPLLLLEDNDFKQGEVSDKRKS